MQVQITDNDIKKFNKMYEENMIDSNLYNLNVKLKNMGGKSVETLSSYLRYDVQYLTSVNCDSQYLVVIDDSKLKNIPVLEVKEWQNRDGYLQAYTSASVSCDKPADMSVEKISYAFQATNPQRPAFILTAQPYVTADQTDIYAYIPTIEIFQFGPKILLLFPYFLTTLIVLLQMTMFYYGCTNIMDGILRFKDFKELSISDEIKKDLLRSVIDRH